MRMSPIDRTLPPIVRADGSSYFFCAPVGHPGSGWWHGGTDPGALLRPCCSPDPEKGTLAPSPSHAPFPPSTAFAGQTILIEAGQNG